LKIKKLLVANRSEIALRIMRSAREMGIETVAVFSEADCNAPFVRFADEAVHIGASSPSDSYLRIDKVIDAALLVQADAIHPGYGFLSENADFADAVNGAGMIFIGPSAESIKIMGDKLAAKRAVSKYNVPLVPGTTEAIIDREEARKVADSIGYPVLIKASAGGGGKGMRVVQSADEINEQMDRAVSEAKSAFGNGSVFIEKYITSPKHIEVQVLGDQHGNRIHLSERDCSIQRRHQKVIEEAPSAVLKEDLRKRIGETALLVAKSCRYYNAGTVEFIVNEKLDFYFLEMNTRLQVEHPVTEMITGIDLVKEQIKIAQGQVLELNQDDIIISGHSIEIRVYAEDPSNNFLPNVGKLNSYKLPLGPGVRVDDGFEEGMEIPINYDPMIAKLITHGCDRSEAIERMKRAISEYEITGVKTTLPFAAFAVSHEEFVSGRFNTHFIENYFSPSLLNEKMDHDELVISSLVAALHYDKTKPSNDVSGSSTSKSKWKQRLTDS